MVHEYRKQLRASQGRLGMQIILLSIQPIDHFISYVV